MDPTDRFKEQLKEQARATACWPIPTTPSARPEDRTRMKTFLLLIHHLHCLYRYFFQCVEMNSPTRWDIAAMVPTTGLFPFAIAALERNLMSRSLLSVSELDCLRYLGEPDSMITILTQIYNAALQFPPSARPVDSRHGVSSSAIESVLGWSKTARDVLPLAEAAVLFEKRSASFLNANKAIYWKSRVLNALTCSPGQGQVEWLALVADTLSTQADDINDLSWYHVITSNSSARSIVVDEIVMTEPTVDRPNELFNMLNSFLCHSSVVELTYKARYTLAMRRTQPNAPVSSKPSKAATTMIKHVRRALSSGDPADRKIHYEKWITSQWDAPSIFFTVSEIRAIVKQADNEVVEELISDNILRFLVVNFRALKAVCARARSLARKVSSLNFSMENLPSDLKLSTIQLQFILSEILQNVTVQNTSLHKLGLDEGLVFEASRKIGTDTDAVRGPRRLWDLTFNVTIESALTPLPWVAVSHSWAQASGQCGRFSINERANIIPWATQEDLRNVRMAILRTGHCMAWMDKICLRQRGIEGYGGALQHLEWSTDIPFIDVAYRKAAKVMIYLEGAGRPLKYRTTFREGSSWIFRKWTAQETPGGVPLILGSGNSPLGIDFFEECFQVLRSWHEFKHQPKRISYEACSSCKGLQAKVIAIRTLRNLPNDAPMGERLECIWQIARGRSAGCAADHVFSLCSLFGMTKRPLYDSRLAIEEAASRVKTELPPSILEALDCLESDQKQTWFDGMFTNTKLSDISDKMISYLAAFSPSADAAGDKAISGIQRINLQGLASKKVMVVQVISGKARELVQLGLDCACFFNGQHHFNPSNRDVYGDFTIWHGTGVCCVILSSETDKKQFLVSDLLILSPNRLSCLLVETGSGQGSAEAASENLESLVFNMSPQWAYISKALPLDHVSLRISS
jgi:hypothetical protein